MPLPFLSKHSTDTLAHHLAEKSARKAETLANAESDDVSTDKVALTALQQENEPAPFVPGEIPLPPSPAPLQPLPAGEPTPAEDAGYALTLESLEQIALQNNPAIAQASASAHKASGFRQQVGKYPNPRVGYSGQQLDDKGTDQHLAYVEQEFVTAKKLKLNEKVLDQEVQSQLWEVEAQRYRVLTDVRTRFYRSLAAQQRYDLAKDFHAVASEGVRLAELRRQALEGSVPEVLQAEIQLNEVDLIQQRAEITSVTTWKELASVAGVSGMQQQRLTGPLRVDSSRYDWDATYAQMTQLNPALIAARSRVSRSIANMSRQEVQAIPNLITSLGAGYDNGTGSQMINVDVGIPLPLFNRNQGNISAAQAEYCRACQEVRRIELSIQSDLAAAARQYDSASVTVERMEKTILPKAKQTLELSEKAYSAGEFGFLEVLIARRTFFDSNLQYNDALLALAESKSLIDGMLLIGGLDATRDTDQDDSLRGQTLSGQ